MNPKCPSTRAPIEAITTEVEKRKKVEKVRELERSSPVDDYACNILSSPISLFLCNRPRLAAITYMYSSDAIGVFMKYSFWFTYTIDSFFLITPFNESRLR